jgi:hypothetical protein
MISKYKRRAGIGIGIGFGLELGLELLSHALPSPLNPFAFLGLIAVYLVLLC